MQSLTESITDLVYVTRKPSIFKHSAKNLNASTSLEKYFKIFENKLSLFTEVSKSYLDCN